MPDPVVSVALPWSGQRDHLENIFGQAGILAETPQGYFPGQTFAGFSPHQETALGLTTQRALSGAPYEQAFQNYLTRTLQQPQVDLRGAATGANQLVGGLGAGQAGLAGIAGGGPNPYLDAQYQAGTRALGTQFSQNVLPGVASQFGAAGRTGSGAHQQAVGQATEQYGTALGDYAANLYGGAYDADAQRRLQAAQALQGGGISGIGALGNLYGQIGGQQLGAAGLAPTAQALDYSNIDRLYGAGQRIQDQEQLAIQDQINRWNFYQNQPWANLERYNAIVGGRNWGGTTATTSPYRYPGVGQQVLGTGLSIAGEAIGGS